MKVQQAQDEDLNQENEENKANKEIKSAQSYEPLCLQVERNFKLRDSAEKPSYDASKPRKLTRPKSPNLQLVVR